MPPDHPPGGAPNMQRACAVSAFGMRPRLPVVLGNDKARDPRRRDRRTASPVTHTLSFARTRGVRH